MKLDKKCKEALRLLEDYPPHVALLVIAFKSFKNPKEYIERHFSAKTIETLKEKGFLTKSLNTGQKLKEVMNRLKERQAIKNAVEEGYEESEHRAVDKLFRFYSREFEEKFGKPYPVTDRKLIAKKLGIILTKLRTFREAQDFLLWYLNTAKTPLLDWVDKWIGGYIVEQGKKSGRVHRV